MKETTRSAIANTIEQFLSRASGKWDWDDFVSCPLQDNESERVREACARLPHLYPASDNSAYCGEEGIAVLRSILEDLRAQGA
jgi:hypothetical protein